MDKFLGMGLKRFLALGIAIILLIVMLKVVLTKYHIPGVSDVVQAV